MIPLFDNVWYMDQQNSRIILLIASQAFASLQPTLGWLHSLCSTCSRMKTVKLEAIYPLVICYIAMENPQHKWSFLAGKIICFYGPFSSIFHSYVTNYQRLKRETANGWKSRRSHGRIGLISDVSRRTLCQQHPPTSDFVIGPRLFGKVTTKYWTNRAYACIYIIIYIYIWLWVKIVYGTFRGVPDVWNEGAS